MKKSLILGSVSLMLLATSCSSYSEPSQQVTYYVPAYNLAVDTSTGDAVVSQTTYTCMFELYGATSEMAVENVVLPGGSTLSFIASEMPFYTYGTSSMELLKIVTDDATYNKEIAIKDFSVDLYTSLNSVSVTVPGVTTQLSPSFYPVIGFKYGSYRINTFWPDVTFTGNTYTDYGASEEYQNETMGYRVVMNLSDSRKYTADVYLLNAKFASAAPTIQVIRLKGLSLEFGANGYTISGENVVPDMVMDGDVTDASDSTESSTEDSYLPMPGYTFGSFKLTTTKDMTGADITYKVGNSYSARFSGSYVPTVSLTDPV